MFYLSTLLQYLYFSCNDLDEKLQYLYFSCNDLDEKTSASELQVPQGNFIRHKNKFSQMITQDGWIYFTQFKCYKNVQFFVMKICERNLHCRQCYLFALDQKNKLFIPRIMNLKNNNAGNKILSKLNKNCTIHLLLEVIIHFNVYMRQFLTGTISSKDFKIWFKEITEEKKY